jgi:hypothetical protein
MNLALAATIDFANELPIAVDLLHDNTEAVVYTRKLYISFLSLSICNAITVRVEDQEDNLLFVLILEHNDDYTEFTRFTDTTFEQPVLTKEQVECSIRCLKAAVQVVRDLEAGNAATEAVEEEEVDMFEEWEQGFNAALVARIDAEDTSAALHQHIQAVADMGDEHASVLEHYGMDEMMDRA